MEDITDVMDVNEAAKFLAISTSWVYKAAKRGEIPSFKLGRKALRFRRKDLNEYIQRQLGSEEKRRKT